MSSEQDFINFVVEQVQGAGAIRYRKMFGGCTLYCNDKVVALICENQLFVKPTEAGRKHIGNVKEAPAYPGARPSLLINEKIENSAWLTQLISVTEKELPQPKAKKTKKTKKK